MQEVDRYDAIADSGERVTILERQEEIPTRTLSGEGPSSLPGLRRLRTTTGEAVNHRGDALTRSCNEV